jgi:hypothetical protein
MQPARRVSYRRESALIRILSAGARASAGGAVMISSFLTRDRRVAGRHLHFRSDVYSIDN